METFLIGINPSLLFTVDGRGLKKLKSTSRTVPTRQRDKIIPHKVLNIRRKDNKIFNKTFHYQTHTLTPNLSRPSFKDAMIYGHVQHCNHLKHNMFHLRGINVKVSQQRNNTTHKALIGEIGQGKASRARIEPTDQITHRMRGLGKWRHAEGVPHACTVRWAWVTHLHGWDDVLGQVNQVQQNTHAPV